MKICTRCKLEKSIEQFRLTGNGKRHSWCKTCTREYGRNHYRENIEYHRKRHIDYENANKRRIIDYLNLHPCVDCGETDVVVLEFDHIEVETKVADIAYMVGAYSWPKIELEIAKCEVRCANCHKRRTARQFNWHKQN